MCIEYSKFPNESVHTECIRYESVRVLTRPLRHRFVIVTGGPVSGRTLCSTRFRHSRKIGWNAIRNIGRKFVRWHQSMKGKWQQRLLVVHGRSGKKKKKGNVGWIARHRGSCPFSRINGSLDCQPCPSVTLCALCPHVVVCRRVSKFTKIHVSLCFSREKNKCSVYVQL